MSDVVSRKATSSGALDVLAGGGEMGARMRALDWSKTAVGPVETWPQSLKIVVRIMLTSRYAMWMGWGPELTFFYNDAYLPTLGVKHTWALGMSARHVWAEIWKDAGPRAESVLQTGVATWDEGLLLFLERRGFPEETYHTFSYSPIPDDQGGVGGMLCVVTEDTERTIGERRLRTLRELSASTASSRTVKNACEVAAQALSGSQQDLPFSLIYLLDEDGKAAQLAAQAGIEPGAAAAPARVLLQDADETASWPFAAVLASRGVVNVRDITERFGAVHAGPWPEPVPMAQVLPLTQPGQEDRLTGFFVAGVSPRRPYDEDYRGFLELVAGHVTGAITDARTYEEEKRRAEALAELDRAKTTFFSNVSHEFRTPLTLMLGPLEDVLARNERTMVPEDRELLTVMSRNGQRLLKLVNTLLDFSRIEAGRVQASYEPTDLPAYTAELASVFRSAVEKAGMKLTIHCPPMLEPVYVDRDMWEKIVLNLVSNAFKYTLEGEIRVSLSARDGRAALSVQDTGTGIPAAELPSLFNRFHRVEGARGRTHEGTGIGLALVQELVKLHKGEVDVESVYGKGSTFTVAVPLGKEHLPQDRISASRTLSSTAQGASPFVEEALRWLPSESFESGEALSVVLDGSTVSTAARNDSGPRAAVVLADDNADMRDYVARLLSAHYEVIAVPDGAEALSAAVKRRPDLVLTDVMMPNLDGFGLLKALRADTRTASIPVIMLSARAGEEARVEGLQAGADDYLIKPFSARELLARVSGTLALARVRREAVRREEELRAETLNVLESITEGFFALDQDFRFKYVNAEAERLTGMRREELFGKNHWDVFPHAVGTKIEREYRRAMVGRAAIHLENYYEEWGKWFEVDAYPSKDRGLAIYFRDITERKRAESALREADRKKDEFLALLAHELRNPLAPLRNGLQVMRLAGGDAQTVSQARTVMERQLRHMVRLIDDLLDISRISRNKLDLQRSRVLLADVINSAVETARPQIQAAGHELTISLPEESIFLDADLTRLAQVFSNLLTNSVKYTERGGHIWLTANRTDDELEVTVRDTGIGIPREFLSSIFDMFSQVDRRIERTTGGLGIGLALVKGLVEMHGGSVEAESRGLGQGSMFTVRLPVLQCESERIAVSSPSEHVIHAGAKRRILVVDDNIDSAESMEMMLTMIGNEVRMAHDGVEAVEVAEQFRPEIILMDVGMPRLNGLEATRQIRSAPWGQAMTIVALTGWGQESDKKLSREAGCDSHLVKPVNIAELERILAEGVTVEDEDAQVADERAGRRS